MSNFKNYLRCQIDSKVMMFGIVDIDLGCTECPEINGMTWINTTSVDHELELL